MRILIAEDDKYSLLILRLMLEKEAGWEVVTTEDAIQAWEKLVDGPGFDLCITDIMMPGMSGLQLAARMRADPRFEDLPIIFCTTRNDRSTVEQAAGLSVSHYITKPYMREHIVRQVRRAVSGRAKSSRIEPTANVAQRLGLESAHVLELLAGVRTEIAGLIRELQASPAILRSPGCGVRINALKGAAANLGAGRLVEELAELEAARAYGDQLPTLGWLSILQQVEAENEHIKRFLEATAVTQIGVS
jgi:two-component system, chemotaxis family, chemotaxis protein CheY